MKVTIRKYGNPNVEFFVLNPENDEDVSVCNKILPEDCSNYKKGSCLSIPLDWLRKDYGKED